MIHGPGLKVDDPTEIIRLFYGKYPVFGLEVYGHSAEVNDPFILKLYGHLKTNDPKDRLKGRVL